MNTIPVDSLFSVQAAHELLQWYAYHKRELPWRDVSGLPDPYRVWLSEIMLQQTTVVAVKPYFERFLSVFPTIHALAASDLESVLRLWAGLGYYSRARNLYSCAQKVVSLYGGVFPDDEKLLLKLPGIGPYTAGAIQAIAFNKKAVAIDGNVERVISRLFAIDQPFPQAKPRVRELLQPMTPDACPGDFVQALMDLGATLCSPKKPACGLCPWRQRCHALLEGYPEKFPYKSPKIKKEKRFGAIFVGQRSDGALLVRTRAPNGLLGGMTEFPGSLWTIDYNIAKAMLDAPLEARWKKLEGVVKHVFSHFSLELVVFFARLPLNTVPPEDMRFCLPSDVAQEAFPSVMRKVLSHTQPKI